MKNRFRAIVVATTVVGASLFVAAPASASCDTELGDMCKFMSVTCGVIERQSPKAAALLGCDRW